MRTKPSKKIKRNLKYEAATAVLRCAAIGLDQYSKANFDSNSTKAIASGLAVDAARFLNDLSSLCSETEAFKEPKALPEGSPSKKNRKFVIYSDLLTVAPMIYDLMGFSDKLMKLWNKYNQKDMSSDVKPAQQKTDQHEKVTKLISMLNRYAPLLEGAVALGRTGAKKLGNEYLIESCTAILTLTRVAEFYAQQETKPSATKQATALAIAAVVILAGIFDNVVLYKKYQHDKKLF